MVGLGSEVVQGGSTGCEVVGNTVRDGIVVGLGSAVVRGDKKRCEVAREAVGDGRAGTKETKGWTVGILTKRRGVVEGTDVHQGFIQDFFLGGEDCMGVVGVGCVKHSGVWASPGKF